MGSVARASNVPYLGDLRQELLDEGPVLGLQCLSSLASIEGDADGGRFYSFTLGKYVKGTWTVKQKQRERRL